MNNDTNSTTGSTKGTTCTADKKGMFYHGNFDRLWPFTVTTTSSTIEPPLDPKCTTCSHQGLQVGDGDATTTTDTEQQQHQQLELGESSSCSSSSSMTSEVMMQPQHFDAEYMCIDMHSTTSDNSCCSSNTSITTNTKICNDARVATQVPTNNTKRSTALSRINAFTCFQCNDMIHAIVSRSFYSLASISMIIMNKSIDKSYHHYVKGDLSILIIVFQSVVVLGCIESCRQCNRSSSVNSSNTYTTTSITTGISATKSNQKRSSILPIVTLRSNNTQSLNYTASSLFTGLFFSFMLVTGMMALHYNSLSMIIVSRNVANLVLMIGDYIAFRKPPDVYVAMIYNILLAGAIIAALKQHTFVVTQIGLLWMMANCISTAGYILCMKHFITNMFLSSTSKNSGAILLTQHQLSSPPTAGATNKITGMIYSIIFIHNALCILFLLPAAYMMGEVSLFVESTAIHTTEYASKTIIAGVLCFIFNYALLNCVEQQSTHAKQHHTNTICTSNAPPHSQQNQRRPSISERRTKKLLL